MLKRVAKFAAGSTVSQGLSAIVGLLLAHWLAPRDYALFTVFMVLLGAISVLTRGGTSFAFNAIAGRVWGDKQRVAQVLKASMRERNRISILILPLVLIFSYWMFLRNQATGFEIALLIFLLIVHWYSDLRVFTQSQVLVLANWAHKTQIIDVILAIFRLAAIITAYVFHAITVPIALIIGACAATLRIPLVGHSLKLVMPASSTTAQVIEQDRIEIKSITNRQLPLEFFYVMQGQIIFVVLAWYAAVEQTAAVGALSRIGQLLLPIQSVFFSIVVAEYCKRNSGLFIYWLKAVALGTLPGIVLIVGAVVFPNVFLLLIGSNYAGLQSELIVFCIGACISLTSSIAWHLLANRGWNRFAWLQVPFVIGLAIIATQLLDLKNLIDILWFQAILPLGLLISAVVEICVAKNNYWYKGN